MTSSLSNQLKSIKQQQIALKVGPHQEQPSILFDKQTARNTSVDTIYSMAILAYDKLQSHLSNSLEQVHNRQELLSESMKQINRNTLTKQENNKLSRKLQKFIIELAPYLLNSQCQQLFEYLLRNFKINVFEAESLALSLLPYWNYQIYQKIVENIPKKQHTGKLTFLNQLTSSEQINFAFIVKTLLFSHALMDKVISIVLEGSLLEIKSQKDEVIRMQDDGKVQEQFLKHPLKNFLLKVFLSLIKQKKTSHYKYIIDFASSCLRIKYPSHMSDENFELLASVLILLSNLVYQNGVSDQYIFRVTKKIISKFLSHDGSNKVSDRVIKIVCDFVFLIWQRKTQIIGKDIVEQLNSSQNFLSYLNKSNASKYMIFHHLWHMICIQGVECQNLLQSIELNIKNQQFFKLYEGKFLALLFESLQSSMTNGSLQKQKIQWITGFIKSNFKFELGTWFNQTKKIENKLNESLISLIFDPSQINKSSGLILLEKIQKKLPTKKAQEKVFLGIERTKMQQEPIQSEQEQKTEIEKSMNKGKKLIQLLRSKGVQVQAEIDFSNQEVKTKLIQMFEQSYDQSQQNSKLTFHQKTLVVEKYGSSINYTPKMFSIDLNSMEYSIPIKYFSLRSQKQSQQSLNLDLQFSFLECLFSFINENRQQLQSILFKQLLRLKIHNLLALTQKKYKQVVVFVAKYYKKLTNSSKSLSDFVQTNQLMLKISEKLFSHAGNTKGKYQNLIHCHCRILSVLINAIDSHELSENSSPIVTLPMLQSSYTSLVQIFGAKQLYLINMGIIELITRKELNYQKLKVFIDDIMIKELNYEIEQKKESKLGLNYYEHALSIGRELVFASYMLGSSEPQWLGSLSPIITSGIAKNQVAIFYGFIKEKLKRNIVRKLFLFFKLSYESKLFSHGFSQYISSIDDYELTKLLHVYSQIYYILLSIDFNDDPKIQAIIQKLMDKITNLFSLDLRLRLFKPLLPNSKLYGYLNEQLESHKDADFEELNQLVNICPDEISIEWVGFVKQCLKRGHSISSESLESTFNNPHFFNTEANFPSLCELFCHLSNYTPESLTPYINQSMNIILAVCQTDPNQDYCLSLLYKVIVNLKEMVDPFVGQIYKYVLECESQFVNQFIEDTVQGLTVPTLIETVKILAKASKHLFNFGVFFKHVCKHGVGHLLVKTLQYYASKIIHSSITDEVDLSNLYELVSEIFLEMTLKFNENELRKVLIDFVRWSEVKQNQQISIRFNMRKIVIGWIYCKLSAQLKGLFTSFYGYVFDSYLKDLQTITQSDNKIEKLVDNKRHRSSNTEFANQVTVSYLDRVLFSLGLLFENDSQKQFMDGTKFDLLSERLSQLFVTEGLGYEQYMKMTSSLSICLLKLCNYLTDDYQLKSLNLKILLLLRHKVPHVQEAILTFMDKLIDEIQDRYLLFINDLVPFLIDNIHNRNEKVKAPIKSIINKFEQMSGGKIESYLR